MSTTIFVTDGGDADAACSLLGSWVTAGLCRSFLVIQASNVNVATIFQQQATVVDAEGERQVDLFPHLAQTFADKVRIVALHALGDEEQAKHRTAPVVDAALALGDTVRTNLGVSQAFVALNLFVPAVNVKGVPEDVLRPDWSLNVVIAPEDRVAPGGSAWPVNSREPDGTVDPHFTTHIALACAVAGELWHQMSSGPFDQEIGSAGLALVVVARSFGRLLDGQDPVPHVLTTALRAGKGGDGQVRWPVPSAAGLVEATNADPYLTAALKETLRLCDGALNLTPLPEPPRPPQRVASIMMVVREFLQFLWDRLRRLPVRFREQVSADAIRRVNALATRLTVGDGSELLVRFGGRRTPEDLIPLNLDAATLTASSVELSTLVEGADRYLPPAYEEIWGTLRPACFGLIDGASMPEGYSTPELADQRPVVLNPQLLAPDPQLPPFVTGADLGLTDGAMISLSPFDPFATDAVVRHVRNLGPGGEGDGSARRESFERLLAWRRERQDALLWRVGSHLGDQIEGARVGLLAALEVVMKGGPKEAEQELAAEGKKVWRSMLVALGVAILTAGLLVVVKRASGFGPILLGLGLVGIAVSWFAAAFVRFLRYSRWEFQLRNRQRALVSRYEHAIEEVAHYGRELVRLGSMYWQYQRWTEVMAHLMHRPWGDPTSGPKPVPALAVTNPPLAFRIGVADLDEHKLVPLAAKVRAGIYRSGWLSGAYRDVEEHAMGELRYRGALSSTPSPLDDQPQVSNRALDELLTVLRSAAHGEVTLAKRHADATREVQGRPPSDIFGVVRVGGALYPDGPVHKNADPVDGLLGEVFPSVGPVAGSLGRFNNEQWTGGGLDPSSDVARSLIACPSSLKVPDVGGVEVSALEPAWRSGRLLYGAIRIDCSEPCEGAHLSLFTPPQRQGKIDLPNNAYTPDPSDD